MKLIPFEDVLDKHIGVIGSKERTEFLKKVLTDIKLDNLKKLLKRKRRCDGTFK